MPVAALASDDGVFVMAAKQARTVFLDRQSALAYDATSSCEGPSGWESLTMNAYIFTAIRCSYYLLGMSQRPFADAAYDNASLVSRFGYIIAHELSHLNLNTGYNDAAVDSLLQRYPHASTRNEGWADVLGTLGVLHTELVDRETLCKHVSQAWCARTPPGYYGDRGQSHPQANVRGDALCQTLVDLGV